VTASGGSVELGAKVTEFETVSDAARTARLDHIGARDPGWVRCSVYLFGDDRL